MNILTAIRSIVFGATVLVSGIAVERSSLCGFDVAGQVGLTHEEATAAVEAAVVEEAAVDANWTALAVAPVAAPVKAVQAKRPQTLFAKMVDVISPYRNRASLNLRRSYAKGRECVIVSVFAASGSLAGKHSAVALLIAQMMLNDGHLAEASGSDIYVFATATVAA